MVVERLFFMILGAAALFAYQRWQSNRGVGK